jgi:hypothetical protein
MFNGMPRDWQLQDAAILQGKDPDSTVSVF